MDRASDHDSFVGDSPTIHILATGHNMQPHGVVAPQPVFDRSQPGRSGRLTRSRTRQVLFPHAVFRRHSEG